MTWTRVGGHTGAVLALQVSMVRAALWAVFPSCLCFSQSPAPGLQVVLQMPQQQTPSWADLTQRVCLCLCLTAKTGSRKTVFIGISFSCSPEAVG